MGHVPGNLAATICDLQRAIGQKIHEERAALLGDAALPVSMRRAAGAAARSFRPREFRLFSVWNGARTSEQNPQERSDENKPNNKRTIDLLRWARRGAAHIVCCWSRCNRFK